MIKITKDPINESEVLDSVRSNQCGAEVLFVGTTRQFTNQKNQPTRETRQLVYECFEEMAVKVLGELVEQAKQKWPVERCSIVHRIGVVEIGQASIAIGLSSPHRRDAFAASEWLMDQIKIQVPIWKQENWADGTTQWVHPGVDTDTTPAAVEGGP